jgi:hypothetical protein
MPNSIHGIIVITEPVGAIHENRPYYRDLNNHVPTNPAEKQVY